MKISYLGISERIKYEIQQLKEEGYDVLELSDEWQRLEKLGLSDLELSEKAETLFRRLGNITKQIGHKNAEPSSWNEIKLMCNIQSDVIPNLSSEFVEDKILGGWLGRSAGCLLGKPIEKIPRPGIKELLTSNGTWPISDYISEIGIPQSLITKYPWNRHSGKESLKENVVCMTEDDDMNFPIMNLFIYENYGEKFSTENILQTWLETIPVLSTFTAERVAYVNALNGIRPPHTATFRNPYREWIGSQIRADLWGWISPAQPARAAEFAWLDASLSHVKNGIYGEIYFASAIAASFKHEKMLDILTEALSFIPPKSRYAEAINFVFTLPIQEQPWEDTLDAIYKKFGHYHWVHAINNTALVTAALISAEGNYEKAICNVVMGGWDTDSNGATVGSLMGTLLGANNLPHKWIKPLNNKIRSSLKGFDNLLLSDLAKRTEKVAKYLPKQMEK